MSSEKFEEWAENHFIAPNLKYFMVGKNQDIPSYNDDDIEIAWDSWQAALAQAPVVAVAKISHTMGDSNDVVLTSFLDVIEGGAGFANIKNGTILYMLKESKND